MRQEFSKTVKITAWKRADGRCEKCTAKLFTGNIEFHHVQEATFSGEPTLENCLCLCRACHSKITRDRAPVIAKSSRVRARHLGIKKRSSFVGSKMSPWKKTFSRGWVRRNA
jgi:5-methylcytosine-specific restriction endonuclease McrA